MIDPAEILDLYRNQEKKLAVAESCTGGLVTASLTDIPSSSDVFERGFITYSNEAKMEILGVPAKVLQNYGAVSPQTAAAMASGCLAKSRADIALSVTGIAGPGGGSQDKPVGLVYFGIAWRNGKTKTAKSLFSGNRSEIRQKAKIRAMELLKEAILELFPI